MSHHVILYGAENVFIRAKSLSLTVFRLIYSVRCERSSKMDTNKEKIRYILQFFFDQSEKAAKAAENINLVYGPDTVNERVAQK